MMSGASTVSEPIPVRVKKTHAKAEVIVRHTHIALGLPSAFFA